MTELLPSRQAEEIRRGLTDYLTTTFGLSDEEVRAGLTGFLQHPDTGIFRGPFVRLRVPFRAAEEGWRDALDWFEGHPPYGHQARAFTRLSSANLGEQSDGSIKHAPEPTLVVTGTGSGKTESFLIPIFDHVLRQNAAGVRGTKALILYPMNALANDQARRITEMIRRHESLKGVRAALYTGQKGKTRTRVTAEGLITDRNTIRDNPPDILLTNYKMLDQLLLRPQDEPVIAAMAESLQYLVLDEFHTYDGAQGTDVAMLLRRLGLAIKHLRPESRPIDEAFATRPLLDVTPIATSATLGDDGDPGGMLQFAETVFGVPFAESDVVTETRQSARQWVRSARADLAAPGTPAPVNNALASAIASLPDAIDDAPAEELTAAILDALYPDESVSENRWRDLTPAQLLSAVAWHPIAHMLAQHAGTALSVDDLAAAILPQGLGVDETYDQRRDTRRVFMRRILALFSHVRAVAGRSALSVDLHLWVRELTRIDRLASVGAQFSWSDDGVAETFGDGQAIPRFPAIYCRHCGRSGWGVELAPLGTDLAANDDLIRTNHANRQSRGKFRALISAVSEADAHNDGWRSENLAWFDATQRQIHAVQPTEEESIALNLPVLMLSGDEADDKSRADDCPACGRTDGIRFLGSAMATMLSVIVTTLFSDADLDAGEKKALVFTDSVQDAAHRAGFIQSRAHVFALRNAIRQALDEDSSVSLNEVAARLIRNAGDDRAARYLLLPPDLVDRDEFRPFWDSASVRDVPSAVLNRVSQRLLFDVEMEFGLQSHVGRTLQLTDTAVAWVDITDALLKKCGDRALDGYRPDGLLDGVRTDAVVEVNSLRWARGVVERMRERGAIAHPWFDKYIDDDGKRYRVWTGRPRGVGMPAFPPGRDAPGFPRVGGPAPTGNDLQKSHLDVVTSSNSWFAAWARKVLGVSVAEGAQLTRELLRQLAEAGALASKTISNGSATVYLVPPEKVSVQPREANPDLHVAQIGCPVCQTRIISVPPITRAFVLGPCTTMRCPGRFDWIEATDSENYYRHLYTHGDVRRVVAREHTGLLEDRERLAYEEGFKASSSDPSAPNVLVATPTLEMGIDIGDLSTVMLAGIPRSVASYLQRVGRAGRLTGNSLSIATVTGRGDQLPRIGDPLSVINGSVRPPATFLSAREILYRQFLAFIIDSHGSKVDPVQFAPDVLASTEPGSFLGEIVSFAEGQAAQLASAFAQALGESSHDSHDILVAFASAMDGAGTSPLAAMARDAVQRWNKQVTEIVHRRAEIAEQFDALEAAAALGLEEDAKSALASAKVTHRLLGRQLNDLNRGYWIESLERFGLLPNYTLMDDSVTLDAAVSWVDPDTGAYQDADYSYQRSASVAINELAPGAYFYAQGLEIPVDAVDLGVGGEAVHEWAFCAQCGYGRPTAGATGDTCPRCGAPGLKDVARRLRVVELEKVSALARRDEASIGDRSDDRRRTRFTVQMAVDLDPANVSRRWFDSETRCGVTFVRDLTIRWLNLGRQGSGGENKMIAGSERVAPLFRVCDTCGKLDSQAGGNDKRDHRSWCTRRLDPKEHTVTIALSRTLVTQGAFFRLPTAITLGDSLAMPSLSAALLRGFRDVLGGDPDHLRITPTVEPVLADTATIDALLLHDTVPGGTGYLAELADPDRTWALLRTAYEVVRDCECRTEQRLACHRCLLPYAGGQTTSVSRASAEQALAKLLRVDETGPKPFLVTEEDPGVVLDESIIEQLFRKRFVERVTALGGLPKEQPSDWGNKVQVTFPGDPREWMLRPQVSLGFTKPDFVLEQKGGQSAPIAIYTDGIKYHGSLEHNRLADDAKKRQLAREAGYRVLAITWSDLQPAQSMPGDWIDDVWARKVAEQYQIKLSKLDALRDDPLTVLMKWMQNPAEQAEDRDRVARALPLMLNANNRAATSDAGTNLVDLAVRAIRNDLPSGSTPGTWAMRSGHVGHAGKLGSGGVTAAAFVLDDHSDAISSESFAASWRLWLHLSNLIGWRNDLTGVEIGVASQATVSDTKIGPIDALLLKLPSDWRALTEYASAAESALLAQLFDAGVTSLPVVGLEASTGAPISFTWEDERVVTGWDFTEEDRVALVADGWAIVEPVVGALTAALVTDVGGN